MRPLAPVLCLLAALAPAAWAQAQVPKVEELAAQGAVRLKGDEIRALHADRTLTFVSGGSRPGRVTIWFAPDGTRAFRTGGRLFTGAWAVRDDARCEETIAGPVVCMAIWKRGDDVFVCDPRETPDCRWRVEKSVPGDSEGLGRR